MLEFPLGALYLLKAINLMLLNGNGYEGCTVELSKETRETMPEEYKELSQFTTIGCL